MTRERRARVIVGIFLFILIFAPLFWSGIDLLVDWLWFNAEGYRVLYLNVIKAQLELSGLAGMGFILVAGLNLLLAHRIAKQSGSRVYSDFVEFPGLDRLSEVFGWVIVIGVLLVGYTVAQWSVTNWQEYLLAKHAVAIGQTDPIFSLDIGFYLFTLPFRWFLYHLALVIVIGCFISAVFLYFTEGGIAVTPRGAQVSPAARTHLLMLAAILMLIIAYRVHLATYNLLYSSTGVLFGAGYTDIHATLPVLRVLMVISILTAMAFILAALRGSLRPAIYSVLAFLVVGVAGGVIYPAIIQHLVVAPNEIDKERPYIENAIKLTRQAYALDRFEEHEFSAAQDLSLKDIQLNSATMRNVRLWDHQPLLTTFAQLQELRPYYDFVRVDNDRYWMRAANAPAGQPRVYRQVSLSPRELATSNLPERTWINEHLIYTHGYGLCLGPVNEFTSDGLPVLFIKDLPPASDVSIQITHPEIYYGEVANSYCFVKTKQQEFDYPSGDKDVYKSYDGSGGVPVEGFLRRLLFTLKFGQKNILFSSDIQPDSRLMIYRNIADRAKRLAPFLNFDGDPYMVISQDGALYWMLDGYTTSDMYPYSDPTEDVGNYMRNSVKATLNAYTGQVQFYISDATDPIIQVYSRIFPGVFKPLAEMPEDLRSHIRYPEGFFSVQAAKYAVYHMTDPRVFYNKEDLWRVAQSAARGPAAPMTPYYTIMKLADVGKTEEFILMVPFTPARKSNMIAWMAARCDAPNYGKVVVFTFPKQKLIYGPQQIESRIDQDPSISQQLTLWGQGGSTVIRGTLLVIPVGNAVLYVEPLYLAASAGGGLPQLKRVLVSYGDQVVMEDTLDAALSRIFSGQVSTGAEVASTAQVAAPAEAAATAPPTHAQTAAQSAQFQALAREANQHFQRALQLQRQGDWAGYGEEIKKLGEVLNRLSSQK
ncbi:MAG: UPF0182 family protein [Deltaproteobacteria bacterium]